MCGIWGFVGNSTAVSIDDAWEGLCSLTDRGPDDWGVYVRGEGKLTDESLLPGGSHEVVLGNRRLSILDLSAAGNQPMVADDMWIVYNGEVYNYRELREELRDLGYEFASDTDTEVVLRAYQEYGPACVSRFRGMFAFVVWDEQAERLFAARDRFGIKPLYYDATDERLAFASEVTSLLASGVTERSLDAKGVEGFLAFGSVPAPRTIVDGVRSLPPGATLDYDPSTGHCTVERYWVPSFGDGDGTTPERIRDLLGESVALRLRSDVPVGAFLSGGLDSSTIVALMKEQRESTEPLHTFSVGFPQEDYSETAFAERVATEFDTEHTVRRVTATDVCDELPAIIAAMDQPTIDGVNTYFVSQAAGEAGLRVALSGLGSDELFYGYPTFGRVPTLGRVARLAQVLPGWCRDAGGRILDRLDEIAPGLPASELADVVRSSAPFGGAYLAVRGLFTGQQREQLLDYPATDWGDEVQRTVANTLEDGGDLDAVSHAELAWYMHNQLLRDTDVTSMTHSLEVRVPFLDTPLAEQVIQTPADRKRSGDKGMLKRSVSDVLPTTVLEREKSGFTFPFAEWLDDDLEPIVKRALAPERLAQTPVDPTVARTVRRQFERDEIHWSRLWAIVVLSLWVDEHVASGAG